MPSKQPETDTAMTVETLKHMAARTASYEEFGRRIFRQCVRQALDQLEQSSATEMKTGESLTFDLGCRARVDILNPADDYRFKGILFGVTVESRFGEIFFGVDGTDESVYREKVR